MKMKIDMDEYQLLVDCDSEGCIAVIAGNIGLDDGSIRDLSNAECEAAGKKHECLIDELVAAELAQRQRDNDMDDAAERAERWAA